jgi:ketosteroid isomerase-like protein
MADETDSESRAVLAANDAFYWAFVAGDALRMDLLWAGLPGDTCIHPGAEALIGAMNVQDSWRRMFSSGERLSIRVADVRVDVSGSVGRVTLVENVSARGGLRLVARVACTNLFVRTDDGWRMTLHHGSIIADDDDDGDVLEPDPDSSEFN